MGGWGACHPTSTSSLPRPAVPHRPAPTTAGGPERPGPGLRKHRHHPYASPASVGRSPSVEQLEGPGSAAPPRKVAVIFDFDECLMRMHVWGTYRNAPLGAIPVADTMFADLPFLRGLIPALHAAGVVLAIATFGRRDVVLKFLEHALGPPLTYFSQISTPASHAVREGSSALGDKNTQLRALSASLGVQLHDILFFDDSTFNVSQADALSVTSVVAAPFCEAVWRECDGEGWLAARGIELAWPAAPAADPPAASVAPSPEVSPDPPPVVEDPPPGAEEPAP
eukprot:EG_transcript_11689